MNVTHENKLCIFMHVLCGKTNGLRLIYHDLGEFTIERWRWRVVREVFCVVGERVLQVESKVGKILHMNCENIGGSMKGKMRKISGALLLFVCMMCSMVVLPEKIYARCSADYGDSASVKLNGKTWVYGAGDSGDWYVCQPIDSYLQITVKGKAKVSRMRYRQEGRQTWSYVELSDKNWSYNSAKNISTVTVKLKSMDGFLEIQLYDSVSSKRTAILKLTGKITKKPEFSSIKCVSSGSAKITWKTMPCTISLDIYRATSANGKYTKIANVYYPDANCTYVDRSVKPGKKYYYKLRLCYEGLNGKMYSSFCACRSITILKSKKYYSYADLGLDYDFASGEYYGAGKNGYKLIKITKITDTKLYYRMGKYRRRKTPADWPIIPYGETHSAKLTSATKYYTFADYREQKDVSRAECYSYGSRTFKNLKILEETSKKMLSTAKGCEYYIRILNGKVEKVIRPLAITFD